MNFLKAKSNSCFSLGTTTVMFLLSAENSTLAPLAKPSVVVLSLSIIYVLSTCLNATFIFIVPLKPIYPAGALVSTISYDTTWSTFSIFLADSIVKTPFVVFFSAPLTLNVAGASVTNVAPSSFTFFKLILNVPSGTVTLISFVSDKLPTDTDLSMFIMFCLSPPSTTYASVLIPFNKLPIVTVNLFAFLNEFKLI